MSALHGTAAKIYGAKGLSSFLNELLTESEQLTLGRRILISQMILAGRSRNEIRAELDVSPNTITTTRKWLLKQLPHYDDVLKAQKAEQGRVQDNKRKRYSAPYTFAAMKRKYPAHFLLFNIVDGLLK